MGMTFFREEAPLIQRFARVGRCAFLLACLWGPSACATMGLRSAVDMTVQVSENTPKEALVYIDGNYIGTLAAVEARGVRVPEGKHRFTVEKAGYFPFDAMIESGFDPIHLKINLLKLPD